MAQWLYRIVPARPAMVAAPTPEEQRIVAAHFDYLVDLRDRGVLILAGRTQEDAGAFGLIVFEADEEAAARTVMLGDPGVANAVFEASLHPFAVAVAREHLET
ncbi:MAG TPA: YciI family protein [Microbacterium sp.]|nr:YciI family protein [Microbacterium sp.]